MPRDYVFIMLLCNNAKLSKVLYNTYCLWHKNIVWCNSVVHIVKAKDCDCWFKLCHAVKIFSVTLPPKSLNL